MGRSGTRGRPRHADVLTPAEWRVAEGVRHGLTNAQIAVRQKVSPDAVKYHLANILKKLNLKNRIALRRWKGINRNSALAKKPVAGPVPVALGALGQIARTVKDVEAAQRFYSEILGLPHLYTFGSMAFFDCGGVRLLLSQGEDAAVSILYFQVGDVRQAHALLEARGVHFVHAPHMIHRHADGTEEWMAFFQDHEGRPLAIMSQVPPA